MNYKENDEWTGFDTEFALAVAGRYGSYQVDVRMIEPGFTVPGCLRTVCVAFGDLAESVFVSKHTPQRPQLILKFLTQLRPGAVWHRQRDRQQLIADLVAADLGRVGLFQRLGDAPFVGIRNALCAVGTGAFVAIAGADNAPLFTLCPFAFPRAERVSHTVGAPVRFYDAPPLPNILPVRFGDVVVVRLHYPFIVTGLYPGAERFQIVCQSGPVGPVLRLLFERFASLLFSIEIFDRS